MLKNAFRSPESHIQNAFLNIRLATFSPKLENFENRQYFLGKKKGWPLAVGFSASIHNFINS